MLSTRVIHARTTDLAISHLRSGVSVEIVGVPGSGRSTLVSAIADALEAEGLRTLRVVGVSQLRDHPLEALRISGALGPARDGAVPTISSTAEQLAATLARTPTVVVLDDADDVDEVSLGVLGAAHRRLGFAVLSVTQPAPHTSTSSRGVLASRPSVRIRLAPLRYDDVHSLLVETLGGPVHADVVSWINTQSGGLAGIAAAIADTARREGSLVQRQGLWVAESHLWSPLLTTLVERLTERLSPAALDGLYKLSLVGGSEQSAARLLVGPSDLEELDDRQLVHFLPGREQIIVAVYPPLIAEHFRRAPVGARRIRLLEEISDALGGAVDGEGAAAGRSAADILVPDRAGASTRESDTVLNHMLDEHWTARTLLRRAEWEKSPTWTTAVPYLRTALMWDYDADAVEHVLATTRPEGDSTARALFYLWHARYLAMHEHDLPAADALLLGVEGTGTDISALLRLERFYLNGILDGIPREYDDLLGTQASASPLVAQTARCYLAGTLVAQGRAVEATALLDFETEDEALARYRDVVLALAYACSGELDRALEWSTRHLQDGKADLAVDDIHAYAYVTAFVLTLQGRTDELRESLSSVLALGRVPLMLTLYHVANLSIAAVVAAREGRLDTAQSLVREAEALGMPPGPLPAMSPQWARSTILAVGGDVQAAADGLWEESLDLLRRGYVTAGVIAGIGAIEYVPDEARIEALVPAVEETDGTLLRPLLEYVRALASGDPERLVAVGDEQLALGRPRYALRASAAAVQAWKAAGMPARAAQQHAHAREVAASLGSSYLSWLDPYEAGADLTRRELDVARLVAQGLTDEEVAEQLALSVRTVENHVQRVLRKVGVDSRAGVAQALSTD